MSGSPMLDLGVIGAGPCGLAVGVAARQAGLSAALFDKGPVVASLLRYPFYLTFFSTAEKLEIAGLPFVTSDDKPTRREALTYYRRVAEYFDLDVRQYQEVVGARGGPDCFELTVRGRGPDPVTVAARRIVYATGYFESPNLLGVPGEDLPHVAHFYLEAHPYWRQRVVVVGASNSAVEAALELQRVGARVTIVHFLDQLDRNVKPWVVPDIQNRLKDGSIGARWGSRVVEIGPDRVVIRASDGSTETLPADFVLALTGYRADLTLLRTLGVSVDDHTGVPAHDPATMQTNVPGVYIAGVLASGRDANRIFIENGRVHGDLICRHIKTSPPRVAPGGGSPAQHRAP
ncbi:MAG TPA: YpdA family putative bacillithiol disulfide reductase [Gemmatimonadales bacterium]|nr:YpdA family putative bacillithiol disulfide reductase [Gemmatimonadales bacterium]